MKLNALFLALVILVLLPTVESDAQSENSKAQIDAFVQERMAAVDIPGAALAIVRGDEVVHLAGYGVANDQGDPVTPQTPFLLASFSKSMTAVAVMQLVEAGRIELDAPIQEYLPWFIPDHPITVRQLLNQTSGLDEGQGYDRNLDPDGPHALEESIRRLASAELNFQPGTRYEYSNSNYDVLGLLIETVSGQSYGDYMQANLFEPLQMTHTFTSLKQARAAGMSNAFYPFFGRQTNLDRVLPYSRATQPSAGIIGSAEDMSRYLTLHLNEGHFHENQILSANSMATLHQPAVATPGVDVDYAMGWAVWPFNDAAPVGGEPPIALSHGGDWLGFNNLMLLIPEQELGLVLLMNGQDPLVSSAFSNIAFDVALLAMGLDAQGYAVQEDAFTRNLRPLSGVLIVLLLFAGLIAWRRLRSPSFNRRDALLFVGFGLMDLALLAFIFVVRLPDNETNVRRVLRFEPDMGLVLLAILLLTIGWGSVRSLWALWRWRQAKIRPSRTQRPLPHLEVEN